MTKTEVRRMLAAAAAACESKKAERIHILELDPADSGFTDFFLISSGASQRQNQTIADAVQESMKRGFGTRPNAVEGYRQGEWILLDYVDFVAHIFSNEKREFYDIERLRKTATPLSLEELKKLLARKPAPAKKKAAAKKSPAKKTAAKKAAAKKPAAVRKIAAEKKATRKTASKRSGRKTSGK
jgi:ribosome-associated protein